jgi:putative RNA 2'-phosphotransferase
MQNNQQHKASATDAKRLERTSKFLSLILRHQPDVIGMSLDAGGWADIATLLAQAEKHGKAFTLDELLEIVETSDKQRFAISSDGLRIRANQGHSVAGVDLGLEEVAPPDILYHGTASRFIESIRATGLRPGSRHHVHLSSHLDTAVKVGARHGKPVVLPVAAGRMHAQGHAFFRSQNGVWLTAAVPAEFIQFPAQ